MLSSTIINKLTTKHKKSNIFNISILDDWNQTAQHSANWGSLPDNVRVIAYHEKFLDDAKLIESLKTENCIVIMRERTPFHASIFDNLPNLQLLVTSAPRNVAIDLNAAKKNKVVVSGTKSLLEPPTELTIALILNLAKKIYQENESFRRNGPWQKTLGMSLHDKTLGILGLGKIGSCVAKIAQAMGMKVIAWSQNLSQEIANQHGVEFAHSKEKLLRYSDIISVHLRLSERTINVIDSAEFSQMKPTALLVNTARAAIVNQEAMISALQSKRIAGAAADVFLEEPLSQINPLRHLNNFLGTPHIGYVTDSNYNEYFSGAIKAIHAFFNGKPIMELY
ncbi:MAG: D-2-hydroxyacid dehydrogenase family protein [Pseudomonadota bacterium]